MRIFFDAVIEIQQAENEQEAVFRAMLNLERLNYPFAMISFLQKSDDELFLIADPLLSAGKKWKEVAKCTKRSFDRPTDLIAKVLKRRQARWILDSRNDPEGEVDQELCRKYEIVTQYAMPLATDKLSIGTLQIDMGQLKEKPESECTILDALASNLAIVIERHRTFDEISRVNDELENQGKIIAFEAAAARIIHELNHSMGDYAESLVTVLKNPVVRSNQPAFEFLEYTRKMVGRWSQAVIDNITALKVEQEVGEIDCEAIVRDTVQLWYRKAKMRSCTIKAEYQAPGLKLRGSIGAVRELFTCLIINAIEANARNIDITVRPETLVHAGGESVPAVGFAISDDGDGIPPEFKNKIGQFGWTSKNKIGHGMGLTLVDLLCRRMGGQLKLELCGRSAGEPRTEFRMILPVV